MEDDTKKHDKTEFDPIKVARDGKMAEQVIWSTNSINAAIDGINKGLQLKANPFIGKDTQLLKPNLVYKRTKEEVEDFKKCMFDPIYFASKCYIKTPTGLKPCTLRDYQVNYINHLVENRFSLLLSCRQAGKCLLSNSLITICVPKELINNSLNKIHYRLDRILRKYTFYIDENSNYIIENIPIFELQRLFDNSIIFRIKYKLYKALAWLERK